MLPWLVFIATVVKLSSAQFSNGLDFDQTGLIKDGVSVFNRMVLSEVRLAKSVTSRLVCLFPEHEKTFFGIYSFCSFHCI